MLQTRLIRWSLLLFVGMACIQAQRQYTLPKYSLQITTESLPDNEDYTAFHQHLDRVVFDHLMAFFEQKIHELNPSLSNENYDELIELSISSSVSWDTTAVPTTATADFEESSLVLDNDLEQISHPIMELLLIEAFEKTNYWFLLHAMLADDVLMIVNDLEITVETDSFQRSGDISNKRNNNPDGSASSSQKLSASIVAGILFASLFSVLLIGLGLYLFLISRSIKSLPDHERNKGDDGWFSSADTTASSIPDDPLHVATGEDDNDDEQQQQDGIWMDEWAKSMTSIRLWEPTVRRKTKRKKAHMAMRPAQVQSIQSVLSSIEEAADENSTVASSSEQYRAKQLLASLSRNEGPATFLHAASLQSITELAATAEGRQAVEEIMEFLEHQQEQNEEDKDDENENENGPVHV